MSLKDVRRCPECGEDDALSLGEGVKVKCAKCEFEISSDKMAKMYIENVLHINKYEYVSKGGEFPQRACPECEKGWGYYDDAAGSYVDTGESGYCFNCGHNYG